MARIYRIQPGVSLWLPPSGVAIALTFWFWYLCYYTYRIILSIVITIYIFPLKQLYCKLSIFSSLIISTERLTSLLNTSLVKYFKVEAKAS
ncbi:Multi-sensor Hybrid Histidine Kinase [Nostoc sp. NIES-3756]|nr:Multi-sensor Hybrid Histidine Kinase [Nostoc sp. NIES-3756]